MLESSSEITIAAGRELDAEVAEKVMGLDRKPWTDEDDVMHFPPTELFSTDISAAWQVVEKMREHTKQCVLVEASTNPEEYLCTVGRHYRGQWFKSHQSKADTAPLAICLAALKAVENAPDLS